MRREEEVRREGQVLLMLLLAVGFTTMMPPTDAGEHPDGTRSPSTCCVSDGGKPGRAATNQH